MAVDARNLLALAPTRAAIRRTEHIDATAFKRHNYRAIRLYLRFAAQSARVVGRSQSGSPSQSSVARSAQQNIAAAIRLIPLRVAISIVRTRRRVVAHTPVLVVKMCLIDVDRISPRQSIRRPAHRHIANVLRTAAQPDQRQRRNQPLPVLRVVSHRRIGRRPVRPALVVHCESRQISMRPTDAAVR